MALELAIQGVDAGYGAVLLGTVQQVVTVTISSEMNVLVVGVLLVVFVVAAPEGILGLVKRFFPGRK